jgi:predicted tellurium resistance membrane protein TerC
VLALLESPDGWIAFASLALLETVLGIDNVIFLSMLVERLPPARRAARASSGCRWPCSHAWRCCSRWCG